MQSWAPTMDGEPTRASACLKVGSERSSACGAPRTSGSAYCSRPPCSPSSTTRWATFAACRRGLSAWGTRRRSPRDPSAIAQADKVVLPGVGRVCRCDRRAAAARAGRADPRGDRLGQAVPGHLPWAAAAVRRELRGRRARGAGRARRRGAAVRACRSEYKVPHMGWNRVHFAPATADLRGRRGRRRISTSCTRTTSRRATRAWSRAWRRTPIPFCAMAWRDNLFATQFHPEKSQHAGSHGAEELRGVCKYAAM